MQRRALYNLLRLNWLRDRSLPVEQWQVENYRNLPIETLFKNLTHLEINSDRISFLSLTEEFDNPEELTEAFFTDNSPDPKKFDQAYLNIFELWRRLVPEKLCLSIFGDELDYQIDLYDQGE